MAEDFLEKIMDKDGCGIHYWVSKCTDNRWLIFLHGAGADHRMFDMQLPELQGKFNILMWDARGHGESRPMGDGFSMKLLVDDLIQIMDREDIVKATLIGQSMGGNLAQEIVYQYTERVENLVFIDCTCNTMSLTTLEKIALKSSPFLLSIYPWKILVSQSAKGSFMKEEGRQYIKETFNMIGKHDFNIVMNAAAGCLHPEKDYRIDKNMLLVCGESDNLGNIKKCAQLWKSQEQYCDFHMIKGASHVSNMDNPDVFNKLLVDFLKKRYPEAV